MKSAEVKDNTQSKVTNFTELLSLMFDENMILLAGETLNEIVFWIFPWILYCFLPSLSRMWVLITISLFMSLFSFPVKCFCGGVILYIGIRQTERNWKKFIQYVDKLTHGCFEVIQNTFIRLHQASFHIVLLKLYLFLHGVTESLQIVFGGGFSWKL